MNFSAGNIYHVYNRGNQKQLIFFKPENYVFFLRKMRKELLPYAEILTYCLMPNHFHWLLLVKDAYSSDDSKSSDESSGKPLHQAIAIILRSYTRAIQKQENFTGSLFQQKTKAKLISTESQLLTCVNYIHQNPMKANLVLKMEEWPYSSFSDYCGFRSGTLCSKDKLREVCGLNAKLDFYKLSYSIIPDAELRSIF